MSDKIINLFVLCAVCPVFFSPLFAGYKEGIETTTRSGQGFHGLFTITSDGHITGKNIIAHYCFDENWCRGYYNYSFDEVMLAPDTIRQSEYEYTNFDCGPYYCFVVRDPSNDCYTKIQVIERLDDDSYRYRYGTNTEAENRLLTATVDVHEDSTLLNVNNLFFTGIPYMYDAEPGEHTRTLSWDPPLVSDIYLKGYIFYRSKYMVPIDTTAEPDFSEWESFEVTTSPVQSLVEFPMNGYFNFMTVYKTGKRSGFLDGWTLCDYSVVDVKHRIPVIYSGDDKVTVHQQNNGIAIAVQEMSTSSISSVTLFTVAGRKVPCRSTGVIHAFTNIDKGSYVLQAVMNNGESFRRIVSVTR